MSKLRGETIKNIRLLARKPQVGDTTKYGERANELTGLVEFEYCDRLGFYGNIPITTSVYEETKNYVIDNETGLLAFTGNVTFIMENDKESIYYVHFRGCDKNYVMIPNGFTAIATEDVKKCNVPLDINNKFHR